MEELIKVSSFGKKSMPISITDGVLTYEGKSVALKDVTHFKYGHSFLSFDLLTVGRKLDLILKTKNTRVDIIFKSYFGFSKHYMFKTFNQILNEAWGQTGKRMIQEGIDQLISGKEFKIVDCVVNRLGVEIKGVQTSWEDISYYHAYDKLVLNNKKNKKVWTNLYFLETYNVYVLKGILEWLFDGNGIEELKG